MAKECSGALRAMQQEPLGEAKCVLKKGRLPYNLGAIMHVLQALRHPTMKIALVTALTLVSFMGCAYRMGAGERKVPGGYRTIAVPVFHNDTHESGIEVFFTNAFIRELQRSNVGAIADRSKAQTTLDGFISNVEYIPVSAQESSPQFAIPKNTVLTTIYRIRVTSLLKLLRNSDQKVLWEGGFVKEATYSTPRIGYEGLASANALYNHSARQSAIQSLANDMMIEAHNRMVESF